MTTYDPQSGRDMPAGPELSDQQSDADEHGLVTAVLGLADVVADVDDLDGLLGQIAHLTVASVPGADGAGVTMMQLATNGGPLQVLAWAVTDPFVREVDHLQYDVLHEGPCLTAMHTRRALVSGCIGSDNRWPRLGARVARMSVHAALSVPLIARNRVVGALNIYAHQRDTFTEHAVAMAEQWARTAAVTVANMQTLQAAHTRATQLQTALTSQAVIDQAIGILRSRSGGSSEEGFARLQQISQTENVKLAVVAQRIVDEAVRRAHARHSNP